MVALKILYHTTYYLMQPIAGTCKDYCLANKPVLILIPCLQMETIVWPLHELVSLTTNIHVNYNESINHIFNHNQVYHVATLLNIEYLKLHEKQ